MAGYLMYSSAKHTIPAKAARVHLASLFSIQMSRAFSFHMDNSGPLLGGLGGSGLGSNGGTPATDTPNSRHAFRTSRTRPLTTQGTLWWTLAESSTVCVSSGASPFMFHLVFTKGYCISGVWYPPPCMPVQSSGCSIMGWWTGLRRSKRPLTRSMNSRNR